ncbi:SGNH/GDSL hydrolase family protein [Nanoarchaeota archaeon]
MFAILCFGDSITFGRGGTVNKGWVDRLDELHSSKDFFNAVYNLGIPGNNSSELLARFDLEAGARIKKNFPDDKFVIVIAIGLNDSRCNDKPDNPETDLEKFRENIHLLLEKAKGYTKHVVVVGLTPVDDNLTWPFEATYISNERVTMYNDIIKSEVDVPFLNMFDKLNDDKWPGFLSDGIHPNDEGYARMFELIKEFLIEKKIID